MVRFFDATVEAIEATPESHVQVTLTGKGYNQNNQNEVHTVAFVLAPHKGTVSVLRFIQWLVAMLSAKAECLHVEIYWDNNTNVNGKLIGNSP